MQKGIRHQRRTTENASEQRARRLNAEPASNDETIAEAGSFYMGASLTVLSRMLNTERTVLGWLIPKTEHGRIRARRTNAEPANSYRICGNCVLFRYGSRRQTEAMHKSLP